jgi:transposase
MEHTIISWLGQHIFIGLDVHKFSWVVAIVTEASDFKTFTQPPKVQVLVDYLRRHFPGATYHCVYEAGYCGFWICEELCKRGIDCIVINPADVPTTDKEHKHKNNRVDAKKLARSLRNGDLVALYVPTREALEHRTLVRSRHSFVCKQTRTKNQVKALLAQFGVVLPDDTTERHWSARYMSWLESLQLSTPEGTAALKLLLEDLAHLRRTILTLNRQIRALAKSERYGASVGYLTSISGISTLVAMILLTELVTIARFKDLDHLASFVGLIPGEDSSGEERTMTQITERKNRYLRWVLTEAAWVAIRYDESLALAFSKLCRRMTKNQAIVRIARMLLNRVRFVLKHGQPCQVFIKAA